MIFIIYFDYIQLKPNRAKLTIRLIRPKVKRRPGEVNRILQNLLIYKTDSGQKYSDTFNFPYIFHIKLQFFQI